MANLPLPNGLSRVTLMVLSGVLILGVGCGGGSVSDGTGPITPVDTTKPPVGTVPRGTITVRVSIDPLDQSVALVAGVNVTGLTVRLTRQLSLDAPLSVTTGADGVARFENLLEGVYNASIDRPLTSSEQAQLPPTDRDASVFAGGARITFTPPQSEVMVPLVASRRGSLMISELFVYAYPSGGPTYGYGTYTEVYNAADTTIYLDGFLLGKTWGGCIKEILPRFPAQRLTSHLAWTIRASG